MKSPVFLGIDTSNYTTSVALVDAEGNIFWNGKIPLSVKEGERGLRQSDAVFSHVKNLPLLFHDLPDFLDNRAICAVGVSTRPRNQDGSYMPCFLSGVMAAEGISASLGVPLFRFSHQCGHMMAAILSSKRFDLLEKEFAAFHVSGGTTEFLKVTPLENGFRADILGGSNDLHAGQLIDRVGVKMGLSFPAGPAMEKLAEQATGKIPHRKMKPNGYSFSLSGIENLCDKMIAEKTQPSVIAAFVLDCIGDALNAVAEAYLSSHPGTSILFAGGVMSCKRLQRRLCGRFDASFADPALSADNAVGIATLARITYQNRGGEN